LNSKQSSSLLVLENTMRIAIEILLDTETGDGTIDIDVFDKSAVQSTNFSSIEIDVVKADILANLSLELDALRIK